MGACRKPKPCRPVRRVRQVKIIVCMPSRAPVFTEAVYRNVRVRGQPMALPRQNTARLQRYSYAVVNAGPAEVEVRLEVSPDGVHYAPDASMRVESGKTGVIVPNRYLRYTRPTLRTVEAGATATVDVFFQAQSAG
ncbi:DUF6385 domain-containing protein [Hydrogenibacillus schlegelii]|nr:MULTISPECIES: DUF6385 domain-containing protein [Hydrogenibacillus]OAR04899.1 hypothetical protein SA87_09865 [Hydrogenibacillus schlegelii]QZA32542.1 hypothetical protein K2M58_09625 [Hydrogenibacillus sp. N12]